MSTANTSPSSAAARPQYDLGTLTLKEVKLALHGDESQPKPERVPTWGMETPEEREAKARRIREARRRALDKYAVVPSSVTNVVGALLIYRLAARLAERAGLPRWTAAAFTALVAGYKLGLRSSGNGSKYAVPGVPNLPVVGALPLVLPNLVRMHNFVTEKIADNGYRTAEIPMPGNNFLLLMDVRDREFMLKTHPSMFPKNLPEDLGSFERFFGELLGRGIFAVDGEEWLDQRKIIAPLFSGNNMSTIMEKTFNAHASHVTDLLVEIAQQGRVVDVMEIYQAAVFDGFTELAFGFSLDTVGEWVRTGAKHEFLHAFDQAQNLASFRIMDAPFIWHIQRIVASVTGLGQEAELAKHCATLDRYISKIVRERLADPDVDKRQDMLSLYIEYARRTHQTHLMDEPALKAMSANLFVAGRDTTSCLLTHLTAKMTAHAKTKLRAELKPYGDYLSFEQSKQLVYTNAAVNEGLRMAPSVGNDFRLCAEDVEFPSGLKAKRGDRVWLCNMAIGRDPKLWTKPDEFIPERWIHVDESGAPVPPRRVDEIVHPVFLGGPRLCLGKDMARFEASVFLAHILNRVDIEIMPGQDLESVVTAPAIFLRGGLKIKAHVI